jgi:hypothetical protein
MKSKSWFEFLTVVLKSFVMLRFLHRLIVTGISEERGASIFTV